VLSFSRTPIFRRRPWTDALLACTMAVGLHLGRGPYLGRDLCRDPDRRSGRPHLDLPEVLEVLLAPPLEWWSTRQPAATARTNPQLMISSFSLPYAVTWANCRHRKPPHITQIVLAVYNWKLFQFAQYPNKLKPGGRETSPLHGRHALP
jgi:hypothetical protein